jgi:ribosomal subunit interface protein
MVKAYDFDLTFTCRHDECDEQFKEMAIGQILKLSKYHKHIIDGDITIDKQNSSFRVEIFLRVPGHTFRAAHVDYKQVKALDSAIEKVKAQLKKLKSKVVDHRASPLKQEVEKLESTESE